MLQQEECIFVKIASNLNNSNWKFLTFASDRRMAKPNPELVTEFVRQLARKQLALPSDDQLTAAQSQSLNNAVLLSLNILGSRLAVSSSKDEYELSELIKKQCVLQRLLVCV